MKKFYAFLAAALMSAFAFASKDVVPSDEVLQGYYEEGKVCVCFFVPADMACNDIVLTGSFNGWKGSAADCVPTEPVEGYDGWYVGSFEPEAEPSATDGICAKPVMLDVDGNFNWEYQVGAATAIRGGVQVVEGAYAGEIDMKHYGTDAPNVFTVDAWKQNPCDAVYHVYTITVISDGCGGLAVPYVVGGMTGWGFTQMQLDVEKTMENMAPTYVYTKKMAEKTPFQVVAGLLNAETGAIEVEPGWNDDSYMQKLIDEVWVRIPGEDGDNLLTHEDPNILFDLRAEDLRWARCSSDPAMYYTISLKADSTKGYISGLSMATFGSNITIEAIPYTGYHFSQWSDGVTDNPRTVRITNDTTFTAEFEKNIYTIRTISSNLEWGITVGDTSVAYLEKIQISATPNNGYHFIRWSDGVFDNPRTITVTQDETYKAIFAKDDVPSNSVPTDAVLADYYDAGKVCVCIFVPADMACNDIVLTGTFNGWSSDVAQCAKFVPVTGYEGWYVTSFTPEAEPSVEKGIEGKPIMLDVDGKFNWAYQAGAATVIRGGVQVIEGLPGEIDLVNYGTDAPNVYTVDAWKENPCTAIYHNYTVQVISDGCGGMVVPYIIGGMNTWKFEQMSLDEEKSAELNVPVYYYNCKAAEGTAYQILSGLKNAETGEIEVEPGWNDDSYLQKFIDEKWVRIPGEDGDNLLTHEDPNILFDLRAEDLRWARCAPVEPTVVVTLAVKLPTLNCPETVEVIGTFDEWMGTALTWNPSTDYYEATLEAKASDFFKFRSAGSWDQDLEIYNPEYDTWNGIGDKQLVFGQLWGDAATYKSIVLDLSDPNHYRWSSSEPYIPTYYSVVFLNWDGKLLSEQTIAYNHAAVAPKLPAREGYIFKGWTADIEHIIARTFAIALYDKVGVEVTYKAEDGDVLFSEHADLHFPDAPSISGKTFAGWLTEIADNTNGIVLRATYTVDQPTEDDDVNVVPSSTTADVTFPYVTGAITYMLVISDMSDNVVCKIMFDASGKLLGIAFAPGRNGNKQQTPQALGFSFTVEGLIPNTTYKYEFIAHDETDDVIETLTGSFTTMAELPTDVESPETDSASAIKVVQNDQVLILRGDRTYTVIGQEVK